MCENERHHDSTVMMRNRLKVSIKLYCVTVNIRLILNGWFRWAKLLLIYGHLPTNKI
jgi:hypothetical protein